MQKQKRRKLWLTRDYEEYELFAGSKPVWDKEEKIYHRPDCVRCYYLKNFCPIDWELITGIALNPGEIIPIWLTVTDKGFKLERE